MTSSNHTCITFGFTIPAIIYRTSEGPWKPSPIIIRDEVEASIKRGLRLFIHNTKDLIDCR